MGIDHLYASTEEAKQMLRDALRDPPGRETVIRSSHQRRMSGPLSRLVNYPGWIGQHTREEAEGRWRTEHGCARSARAREKAIRTVRWQPCWVR
jgi:hypothetical protein